MRYAIVIEKAENNFSPYVPDLPGCVATGASVEDVEMEIKEAIVFHLEGRLFNFALFKHFSAPQFRVGKVAREHV